MGSLVSNRINLGIKEADALDRRDELRGDSPDSLRNYRDVTVGRFDNTSPNNSLKILHQSPVDKEGMRTTEVLVNSDGKPRGTPRRGGSILSSLGQAGMLVLSRKMDEKIMIGDSITIQVVGIRGDKIRLGIKAPHDVPVHREEVYREIKR